MDSLTLPVRKRSRSRSTQTALGEAEPRSDATTSDGDSPEEPTNANSANAIPSLPQSAAACKQSEQRQAGIAQPSPKVPRSSWACAGFVGSTPHAAGCSQDTWQPPQPNSCTIEQVLGVTGSAAGAAPPVSAQHAAAAESVQLPPSSHGRSLAQRLDSARSFSSASNAGLLQGRAPSVESVLLQPYAELGSLRSTSQLQPVVTSGQSGLGSLGGSMGAFSQHQTVQLPTRIATAQMEPHACAVADFGPAVAGAPGAVSSTAAPDAATPPAAAAGGQSSSQAATPVRLREPSRV